MIGSRYYTYKSNSMNKWSWIPGSNDATTYRKGFGSKHIRAVLCLERWELIETQMRDTISLENEVIQVSVKEKREVRRCLMRIGMALRGLLCH